MRQENQHTRFIPQVDSWQDLQAAFSSFPELVKSRLTLLVVMTTAAGYVIAWGPDSSWLTLLHVLLGTSGVAAGAAVLNELLEIQADAKMGRTKDRPLPAGRINPQDALLLGSLLAGLGIAYLVMSVNYLSGALALITLFIYIFVYTPMKRISAWNTLVGAVPGALPPLIGWAAAANQLNLESWLYFGLQFCWQLPHFLAIAWLYRQDYKDGGFKMITDHDPNGKKTSFFSLAHTALLLPLTAATFWWGESSWIFLLAASLLALIYLKPAIKFYQSPDNTTARPFFLMSLLYLPGLYLAAILDRLIL
ncbi:MAG: heme o synthase [Verrucomicrobiota bacterium]